MTITVPPRPNEISTHRCSINKNQKPIRKNINSKEHASNHPITQLPSSPLTHTPRTPVLAFFALHSGRWRFLWSPWWQTRRAFPVKLVWLLTYGSLDKAKAIVVLASKTKGTKAHGLVLHLVQPFDLLISQDGQQKLFLATWSGVSGKIVWL